MALSARMPSPVGMNVWQRGKIENEKGYTSRLLKTRRRQIKISLGRKRTQIDKGFQVE